MAQEGMGNSGTFDEITIGLTLDQAVVLLDLLSRWSDEEGAGETPSAACFGSTAEAAVLHAVSASLERQVSVVFRLDYDSIVAEARSRLADGWGYSTLRG